MPERFVGIDVALRDHRVAVLDREGEAVGKSFTATATKDGFTTLLQTLQARGATPAQSLVGLEATGHLWENLEAALVGAGYRVIVDRISHEVEYYRAFLKHAVLTGAYVINNPFWWTADDKFFNYAVAQKVGVAVPKTIVLPQKRAHKLRPLLQIFILAMTKLLRNSPTKKAVIEARMIRQPEPNTRS